MPRRPLLSIIAPLVALLLVACSASSPVTDSTPDSPDATAAPASGGTLTVGRTAAPDSLNPGSGYVTESFDIWFLVYDTLIYTDLRNQPQPLLASEWSVGEDGRTWTFKLREGATWHDGTPLTAEDVVFTFELLRDFESFGLFKVYADVLERATATDATTAVLTFSEPVADTDERFSSVPILPRHIWSALGDEAAVLEYENTEMIGSGPFRMAEYVPGQFTRLEAVKDHYFDPPAIDEVIFRVFGNGDAMVQALRIGEIDLIEVQSNTVVRSLQSEASIQVEVGTQAALTDIFFNVVTPENCPPDVGVCSGHPALQDVRVRQRSHTLPTSSSGSR
ncbi:ABC transporter substrate-binding protein, partial [Candidatus Gracilibacteria bacterium]|nr:ABC transporter substrate-binding protein [Candidatus Gracilibacteria bacterium]